MRIMAFGGVGWDTHSKMSKTGHLYSYDDDQNATFPAKVTATQFVGPLQGNAATATSATSAASATKATNDGNGNNIVNTYATKAALEKETNCNRTLGGTVSGPNSVTLTDIATAKHNVVLTLSDQDSSNNGYIWKHNAGSSIISGIEPTYEFVRPLESFSNFYDNQPAFEFLQEDDGTMNTVDWTDFTSIMCYTSAAYLTNFYCTVTADTNASNQYYIAALFYSAGLHKVFALPTGTPYATTGNEHCSAYFDSSTGKLYVHNTFINSDINSSKITGKHVYEGLPSDLVYLTSCIYGRGTAANNSVSTMTLYTCNQQKFYGAITDDVVGIYDFVLEKCGTYLIPYGGSSTQSTLYFNSVPVPVDYVVTYLSDSSHVKLLPHIRDCSEQNFLEEFNKVVGSGRADPDDSTPGILYFKYL
jgi:hypothetical protein